MRAQHNLTFAHLTPQSFGRVRVKPRAHINLSSPALLNLTISDPLRRTPNERNYVKSIEPARTDEKLELNNL